MRPVKKPPVTQALTLFGAPLAPTAVTIRARVNGHLAASAVLMRRAAADGVTWRDTTLAHEGFVGTYFDPPGDSSAPAVLQIGGSEGRHSYYPGAVLASHGYPTLSLAYFNEPGLPKTLKNIPLEYFAKALRWLAAQPGVDPSRVITLGVSRGGEAALLVGATYPNLVHGAFSATGSSEVGGAWPQPGDAWTLGGKSIPYGPIPVWQIAGPVVATAGGKDRFGWTDSVQRIVEHAREHGRPDIVGRIYPTAGHGVGWAVPNMPVVQVKIGREYIPLGGSPAGNARGYAAAWSVLLRFLETLPH
jgi:dienelactone hydrolase